MEYNDFETDTELWTATGKWRGAGVGNGPFQA